MSAQGNALPPRESIIIEGSWRVAHAFNTVLPGWLVVLPKRHITSLDQATIEESQQLGPLLRRCSLALKAITGCEKSYFMSFGEAEGFSHLHVHVVPRMSSFTSEQIGPKVFSFLGGEESHWLTENQRDSLALKFREVLKVD
jgi:diadenosine tetraphosphate (Ap4A) HIT family hydrolase